MDGWVSIYTKVRYGTVTCRRVDSYFANDECRALGLVCGGWDEIGWGFQSVVGVRVQGKRTFFLKGAWRLGL